MTAINDADAAGLAELHYGAARDVTGTVLLLTLGTGIGTALFVDGRLVPNTELGHLQVAGREAEKRASGRAKVEQQLELGRVGRANCLWYCRRCTHCCGPISSCCAAASPKSRRNSWTNCIARRVCVSEPCVRKPESSARPWPRGGGLAHLIGRGIGRRPVPDSGRLRG